jgi:nucleotide-binding universal stress UspA family protein
VRVVAWIVEGTWRSCVDAASELAPAGAEVSLLYVVDDEVAGLASGGFGARLGLRGRGHGASPGRPADDAAAQAGRTLLARAAERLARPSTSELRHGRVEREVVLATEGADLLVVARDGDRSRLGPKSLGHGSRFVVDHAPCSVVLVWPEATPAVGTVPPPPPGGGRRGHQRHGPPGRDRPGPGMHPPEEAPSGEAGPGVPR